jgi:outer membrane protein assembly factor BamB
VLYIYDAKAGTLLRTYSLNITYPSEAKWGGNYPIATIRIADGKIYLFTAEHSPDSPPERGTPLACVDIETGEELWSVPFYASHWATNPAIADGYLVYMNAYDNQIYCFGKGPSTTTVEAPMTAVTVGDSVVIQGTVTDQSAGAKGTPAIADESMSQWMEYLYMQQPMPTTATGVQVTIDAVDPNNNFVHIGTATSDTDGVFSYAWKTPDVPGKYTIIATFEGSESYYASYAQTAMVVTEAPAATPTPTPLTLPPYESYTIGAAIAIIIAIAIIGILILRKK